MGQKIKHRQQRKPRSLITRDMLLNTKPGPHKDKREKRKDNPRKSAWESDSGE